MSTNLNLDLDFQDYTPTSGTSKQQSESHMIKIPSTSDVNSKKQSNQNYKQSTSSDNIKSNLTDEVLKQLIWATSKQKSKQIKNSNSAGGWGMNYLSQYFDITTSDVLERILWSAIPIRKTGIDLDALSVDGELKVPLTFDPSTSGGDNNLDYLQQLTSKKKSYSYIERFIQSRPDLYGPFWVSTTLIFAIAIFSNLISFINYRSKLYKSLEMINHLNGNVTTLSSSMIDLFDQPKQEWHYTMDELNMSASIITFYIVVIPTLLWFLFWFRGCAKYYTLIETICAYGYSLSIFIPLAGLLMIQMTLLRYFFIIIASLLSGLVLMMSFVPTVKSDPNSGSSHIILVFIPTFQFGLAYILHRIMLQS